MALLLAGKGENEMPYFVGDIANVLFYGCKVRY